MQTTLTNAFAGRGASGAQRFSTAAFAPGERVSAWRELYGSTIARLDFDPDPEGSISVDAAVRALPGLGIASLSTFGLRFNKPRKLIDSDDLIVVLVENGTYVGRQLGREVRLGAGEAAIRLNSEVTSGEVLGRLSIIRVPAQAIAPVAGNLGDAVQRRIPADTEALQLLRPYLRSMHDCVTPETQRLAARHVQDLVAMLISGTRNGERAGDSGIRAARLRAIKEDIVRNLEHGDVSLAAIVARHRVSPRYVQKLFSGEGTTFSEHVLDQRLAHAHRLLADPRRSAEKVTTTAFAAGFGDVSYFYRAFRRRYGMLPTDVRAQAQGLN